MMKKVLFLASIVCGLFMFWGCDEKETGGADPQDADFTLKVSDITSVSCSFSVVPADEEMPYVVMLVEKSEFDAFENEYDYQDNDLEWFNRKAQEEGKDIEEWLEDFLHVGTFEGKEAGLMPATSYYLYAYGLDYSGFFMTGVTKIEFSTPAISMSDATFELNLSDLGMTGVRLGVTASDEETRFFMNIFSKAQYEEWGGDESAFANHAAALVDYYIKMGQPLDAIVANLTDLGHAEEYFDGLTAGTEYVAYAVGVDENFFVNTKVQTMWFTTEKASQSSNTFTIDIKEATYCSVIGTVTPSNDDSFLCTIQEKSQFEEFGSDEEIMYHLVETYQKWEMLDAVLHRGEVVELENVASLSPETDYLVVCFGWDGAPTTGLTTCGFRTASADGDPLGQEFSFVLSDLKHNKVTVNISPKLGLHYFYDCMPVSKLEAYEAEEGSQDEAICRFLDEGIDFGADYFGSTRAEYLSELGAAIGKEKWTFDDLEQDTEYVIVAATVNLKTGEISARKGHMSEVFRTSVLIESNAAVTFIIDKYYDGTELSELDPVQFGKCAGLVMVPYEVVPNEDAVRWRTTFEYGDYLEWADRDDVLFALDYKCDVDKTQGYAVVHYDQIVSFLGIAENEDGYTGPYTIYEFKAEKGGTSPAQEFIDSL